MNIKKTFKLFIAFIILIPLIMSCSDNSDARQTAEAQESPNEPANTQAAEEIPVAGGDMFISMPEYIDTLDPLLADNEELINILSLIYDTPFKYNADGSLNENLIESWEVDESKQLFTFKIREDVYFSDGTQLTADDIVYSANRLIGNSQNNSSDISTDTVDQEQTSNDETQPLPETNAGLSETSDRFARFSQYVDNIRAADQFTVELRMNKAGSAGLHFMTFPVMKQTSQDAEFLVGTGPYMAESFTQGEDMRLNKNPLWWGGTPYIDTIVARSVSSQAQALDYVESSIIDFTTTDALYAGNYRSPGVINVIDYVTNYYDCLVPNLLNPKMQNVLVRQAVSYGIDRREILATVLLNHGVPTNLPIAPDFFAYDSEYKINDYGNSEAIEFLKQAGYATDETSEGEILTLDLLVLDERNAAYRKEAARAIKKQLEELGITVNIVELPQTEYREALNGGNFDLAYVSYYLDIVPDVEELFSEDSVLNVGHVSSEEITEAARACEAAVTDEEVIAAYSALQRVLAERVPQIGLYFRTNSIVCDETIHGIKDIRQNLIFNDIAQWYNYLPSLNAQAENNTQTELNQISIDEMIEAQNANDETQTESDSGIEVNYASGDIDSGSDWITDDSQSSNGSLFGNAPNIYDDAYNTALPQDGSENAEADENNDEFTPLIPIEE